MDLLTAITVSHIFLKKGSGCCFAKLAVELQL